MPTNNALAERAIARDELLALMPRGSTVYTLSIHRSAHTRVVVIRDNKPLYPVASVARVLGRKTTMATGTHVISLRGYYYPGNLIEALSNELYGDPKALKHENL